MDYGQDDEWKDRDHLRKVFFDLGDKVGAAFDKVDQSRLDTALLKSACAAGKAAHEAGDTTATIDWYKIYRSLVSSISR